MSTFYLFLFFPFTFKINLVISGYLFFQVDFRVSLLSFKKIEMNFEWY